MLEKSAHLALVANSVDSVKDGEDWRGVPDNKIFVIDLAASPPAQIATVEAGKQTFGRRSTRPGPSRFSESSSRAASAVNGVRRRGGFIWGGIQHPRRCQRCGR